MNKQHKESKNSLQLKTSIPLLEILKTFSKMASSVVPVDHARNGFTIVTHVVPGGTEQYVPKTGGGVSSGSPLKKLLNREPKALGTVQIMIGIMTLLFGTVSVVYFEQASVFSGVTFWGSCSYIASGTLCIVAINQTHPSVVLSLGNNLELNNPEGENV
ncbi:hypothetical protein AOLI_G00003760 [Acnodon oligacanthus]